MDPPPIPLFWDRRDSTAHVANRLDTARPALEQEVPSFSRPHEPEDSPSCPLGPEMGTQGRGGGVTYPSNPPRTLTPLVEGLWVLLVPQI